MCTTRRGVRIFKQWPGFNGVNECEAYFYGAMGRKLESYSCEYTPNTIDWFTTLEGINTYFGGKMLSRRACAVKTTGCGERTRGARTERVFSYFPWGEGARNGDGGWPDEVCGILSGSAAGQDYAMARYYSATTGNFWSPDPGGMKNASSADPMTWNRFGYVMGDPINRTDVRGLCSDQDDPPCYRTDASGEADGNEPPPPVGDPGYQQGSGGGGFGAVSLSGLLNQPCQNGLATAMPASSRADPNATATARLNALNNAWGATGTLISAADTGGLDVLGGMSLLSAIGIRESGFQDINQPNGNGVGIFQIDLGQNPNVTAAQANGAEHGRPPGLRSILPII